jgi:filamentous hemagglutinin
VNVFIGLGSIGLSLLKAAKAGKAPIWSESQSETSVENAFKHFKKHGNEFPEIQNSKQYVEEAKEFLNNPPKGTFTKIRSNGDILRYDPNSNTFGVQRADGAPKTMFKPKGGIEYWNTQ